MKKSIYIILSLVTTIVNAQLSNVSYTNFKYKNINCNAYPYGKGSLIFVPQNAFVFEDGLPCKDSINIKYKENIIELQNLNSESSILNISKNGNELFLNSIGFFEIQAETFNGKPLKIATDKAIQVRIKTNVNTDNGFVYKYNSEKKNWADYDKVYDYSFRSQDILISEAEFKSGKKGNNNNNNTGIQYSPYSKFALWRSEPIESPILKGTLGDTTCKIITKKYWDAIHEIWETHITSSGKCATGDFLLFDRSLLPEDAYYQGIQIKKNGVYSVAGGTLYQSYGSSQEKVVDVYKSTNDVYRNGEVMRISLNEKFNLPAKDIPKIILQAYFEGKIQGYFPYLVDSACSYYEFMNHFAFGSILPIPNEEEIKRLNNPFDPNCCPKKIIQCHVHCPPLPLKVNCLQSYNPNDTNIVKFQNYYDIIQQKRFDKNTSRETYSIQYFRLIYEYKKNEKNKVLVAGPVFKYEDVIALLNASDFKITNARNNAANFTAKQYYTQRMFQGNIIKTSITEGNSDNREQNFQEN